MKKILFLLAFVLSGVVIYAQESKPFDPKELEAKLKKIPEKKQIKYLDSLGMKVFYNDTRTSIGFYDFSIRYLKLNGFQEKEIAPFYMRRGQTHRKNRKFSLALNDLLKAEEIYLREKNISGLQDVMLSLANLYSQVNDNVKAIKFAVRSKEYAEKLKNPQSTGVAYNTLANMYKTIGQIDSAFHYYRKAVVYLLSTGDKVQGALLWDNIGMLWIDAGNLDSAKFYNERALSIAYELKHIFLELQLLANSASIAENQKRYDDQMKHSIRAKHLADSLKVDIYMWYTNLNYSAALINLNRQKEAIPILRSTAGKLFEIGDIFALETAYSELSRSFEQLGRYDSALYYNKLKGQISDSLDKIKSLDKVNEFLAQIQIEDRESKITNLRQLNAALEEKNELNRQKDRLKSIIIWGAAVLLLIIVILLVITFKRFRINKKLSDMLGDKNQQISYQNAALTTKNNEITDSINYAQRIQRALLPSVQDLETYFEHAFVLYKPKDIVSGDFYWMHREGDVIYFAVGDCTGHGVPGGFMSMLGHSFLNEIVNEKRVHEPAEILNLLRDRVIASLRQTGAMGENKDGMDITFIRIDKRNQKVVYAAANNNLYVIHNDSFHEHPADKQPIGYYSDKMRPFTQREISLAHGDLLYLCTDGYADQFGGPKGKKLKHSGMQKIILANYQRSMPEQKQILEKEWEAWRSDFAQTDDVCVVGIRI